MAKSAITTYGEALFQIAVESSSCLPMLEEVTELKKILSDNPELGSVMLNPRFSKEAKLRLFQTFSRAESTTNYSRFSSCLSTKEDTIILKRFSIILYPA